MFLYFSESRSSGFLVSDSAYACRQKMEERESERERSNLDAVEKSTNELSSAIHSQFQTAVKGIRNIR